EIGRGTSTFDGMALAQAIVEHIHYKIGAKTLFSTHYHELTDLEDSLAHLKNIYVRAEEYENEIVFLHKVEEGRANESYGIHVAKLAQLPNSLIDRAANILAILENDGVKQKDGAGETREQLAFFEIEDEKKDGPKKEIVDKSDHAIIEQLQAVNILDL